MGKVVVVVFGDQDSWLSFPHWIAHPLPQIDIFQLLCPDLSLPLSRSISGSHCNSSSSSMSYVAVSMCQTQSPSQLIPENLVLPELVLNYQDHLYHRHHDINGRRILSVPTPTQNGYFHSRQLHLATLIPLCRQPSHHTLYLFRSARPQQVHEAGLIVSAAEKSRRMRKRRARTALL